MQVDRTTHIILCRHGESEGNREKRFGGHGATTLTAHGRAQARAAGRLLINAEISAVYSSDLPRAVETAEEICAELGVSMRTNEALRERSVGQLTGLTFEEAQQRFPDAYAALLRREADACPPGGETYAQCRARVAAFFEETLSLHAGSRILFVSHNLALQQLIFHILGMSPGAIGSRVFFQIDNCALHRFERLASGAWQVLSLNERAPLGPA